MLQRMLLGLCLASFVGAVVAPAQAQQSAPDTRTADQKEADAAAGAAAGGLGFACIAGIAVAGFLFYFAPSLIGIMRGHPNLAPIVVVNLFLGWTLVGWVVSLAWALTAQDARRYRAG